MASKVGWRSGPMRMENGTCAMVGDSFHPGERVDPNVPIRSVGETRRTGGKASHGLRDVE